MSKHASEQQPTVLVADNIKDKTSYIEELDRSSTTSTFDDSIEQTPASRAVWLITFTVAMGGFLFGQSIGVVLEKILMLLRL
jgi:hypothetical protein